MGKAIFTDVTPSVLKWAREDAGIPLEVAAHSLKITPEQLSHWEIGETKPSLTKAKALSRLYHRPLLFFFLPEPPERTKQPSDFRIFTTTSERMFSTELRLIIRRASALQRVYTYLNQELGVSHPTSQPDDYVDSEVVRAAARLRKKIGVTYDFYEDFKGDDPYFIFRLWRGRLEQIGIVVCQSRLKVSEARGFTLYSKLYPLIWVNRSDHIKARIFTLFHEYAHIMLRLDALSDCGHDSPVFRVHSAREKTELWCNAFAGAFLVGEDHLDMRIKALRLNPNDLQDESVVRRLASFFQVSKYVALRRLLDLSYVDREFYWALFRDWQQQDRRKALDSPRASGGGENSADRAIHELGSSFVRLALEAVERETLSSAEITRLLGMQAGQIPALEKALEKTV